MRANVAGQSLWPDACRYVARQAVTPECAPCDPIMPPPSSPQPPSPPSPPSLPPLPPLSPTPPLGAAGLFCFIVIAIEFGDVPRARSILDTDVDAGFSGCDSWRIYSNVSFIPGLSDHPRCSHCTEKAIDGSMNVPYGKPSWASWAPTALNTPIFQEVWRHVLTSATYQYWAWTIKTEVDVVFKGSHLRRFLMSTQLSGKANVIYNGRNGVGIRNGMGLKGPIEALTRHAVDRYATGEAMCDRVARDTRRDKGEDWWLALCMEAVGVPYVYLGKLILNGGSNQQYGEGSRPSLPLCDGDFVPQPAQTHTQTSS